MSAAGQLPGALERTLGLLHPAVRPARPTAPHGYLDLLPAGGEAPPPTGFAQRLMLTGAVPFVYERWWRPALGRVAKGPLGPGMAEEHRLARLLLDLRPGDGVLDVACGPGNFTRPFARLVGPSGLAVGLDASPTMLARAVRDAAADRHQPAWVRGDATDPPFRDASFDAVCCFAALHLFDDPWVALDGMTRVLTRGGRIALLTSCRTSWWPLRLIDGALGTWTGMHMFERDEVTHELERRGYTDVRVRASGLVQIVGARKG